MNTDKVSIKIEAVRLLRDYLGSGVAEMYTEYYRDKSDRQVVVSVKKLLNGYLGKNKVEQVMIKNGLIV